LSNIVQNCVSVILPVHNQADHVREIVANYSQALSVVPGTYEIVLVTNACSDQSVEVCQKLVAANENVVCVDSKAGGWGLSVKLGLSHAKGDLLCYTNSARTTAEILTLTILYAKAFPNVVVKANRKVRDNWRRRLGSLIYNLECRAFFDLPVWDINGTPKVFPRSFDKLMDLQRVDDLIDAEFNAICRSENYPIIEVPVLSTRRHGGKSTTNYGSAFKMYWGAFELWRDMQNRSQK
jgi:glycosyltransferase involved in cell wall biosynthesis